MKILLLNIGNTHTQAAMSDGREICIIANWKTAELTVDLLPEADAVAVASVVPDAAARLAARNPFVLQLSHAAACGVSLAQVDASTLGMDRLANVIELAQRCDGGAALDCGTAITLEVLGNGGVFLGGAIAPGRRLMRRSLSSGTAQLPDLPLQENAPESIGINTATSIYYGIDRGAVGMVREWVNALGGVPVYCVGGDAPFFLRALPELQDGGALFTLQGLLRAYLCNR
ncbi:MAG: type III pantothenate kinase [Lentisphaeria bacterium]|nr:type III pantothenate kinase [Lentisphaeria bacterium]